MNKTADILFEFVKDMIYHPAKAKLDIDTLPEDFKKLGMGLQLWAEWYKESNLFSKAIVRGELSTTPPDVENVLAAPMKALQGSLRHLTWQTQQIAKGDFSQRVDFMGEFSDAFNTMTRQLSERTESLIKEKQLVDTMNLELKKNLDLMLTLTNYTNNMIFVISEETKELIFKNHSAQWYGEVNPKMAESIWKGLLEKKLQGDIHSKNWEICLDVEEGEQQYYDVESFYIQWSDIPAIVHIVIDDTQRRKQELLTYKMAYVDVLTGLKNRRYAFEEMERLRKEGKDYMLTLIDMDYLKYCNDVYGHEEGDRYLKNTSNLLKTAFGEGTCRVGGDEFYIIKEGRDIEAHDKKLEQLRTQFMQQEEVSYIHSFSFGTTIVDADSDQIIEQYIIEADRKMYEYKKKYRKNLEDVNYHDSRL